MIWFLFIFSSVCLHVHGDEPEVVNEELDFGSMRIKELKTRLSDLGAHCRGCSEKRDFIELLKKVIKDPSLAKPMPSKKKRRSPPPPPENAVIEGTTDNFDEVVLQSKIPVMVEFFAPWCGHCKTLAPNWKAAAGRLLGKVKMVAVDATVEKELASRYKVEGFPTLKVFRVGANDLQDYQGGGRGEDHLVKAGLELIGEVMPTVEVSDVSFEPDTLHEGLETIPKALVAFTDYSCGKPCVRLNKNFMKVIKTLKKKDPKPQSWAELYLVDCTDGGCEELGVDEYPKVVYFENGKQTAIYERKTSTIKLLGFAKRPSAKNAQLELPEKWGIDGEEAVPVLTPKNYKKFLKEHKSTLVFFYAPWCGHCKTAKPDIVSAAQELADLDDEAAGSIAGIDCDTYKSLCSRYKVSSFPTIVYFKDGKNIKKYNGERNKDAYLEFLDDPDKVVEKAQEPFLDGGVESRVRLLGNDLPPFVSENPSVLVMFYAPWCGHCKSAKPGYAEAASELEGSGHVMAAVDCTVYAEACAQFDVKGYPTIKYFSKGKPSDYEGARDKNGWLSFLRSKSGTKSKKSKKSASQKASASRETPSMETPSMETPEEDIAHDEL